MIKTTVLDLYVVFGQIISTLMLDIISEMVGQVLHFLNAMMLCAQLHCASFLVPYHTEWNIQSPLTTTAFERHTFHTQYAFFHEFWLDENPLALRSWYLSGSMLMACAPQKPAFNLVISFVSALVLHSAWCLLISHAYKHMINLWPVAFTCSTANTFLLNTPHVIMIHDINTEMWA
jgi:hypothetical protein